MMVTRYDFIPFKATVTPEGWIRDRPVITRTGIFEYRTRDGKTRREFRPDTEVFNTDSLVSIAGIPITDNHIGILTAKNHKGVIGTVISSGLKEDTNVLADIIIHDSTKLGDRRDLSLGYTCDLDETPGQTENGEKYDAIQKNIKYNHLAVVRSGRAGNARLRLDSSDAVNGLFDQENDMTETKLVTIRLDNIDYPAAPEIANRLAKYETEEGELRSKLDSLTAERDSLMASLNEEKDKTDKAAKAAVVAARARIKLEELAKNAGVTFDDNTTDRQIKESVVKKLRGDTFKFDGKSDDYVDSAFDLSVTEQRNTDDRMKNQRQQMNTRTDTNDSSKGNQHDARQRMIMRMKGINPDQKSAA